MMRFHRRCGDRVSLLHDNTTAVRNFVEFNHGLILSADPLTDDVIFEVCIDRKVNIWNGSLEIGVTTLDPEYMELPATATKLRNTAWIMSGSSVVKDGVTLIHSYGPKLDSLHEGDCLGVMRTSKDELMFYVNGRCLGIAATEMPPRLFAVIDLYGQCVQVSIMHTNCMRTIMENSLDQIEEDPNNDDSIMSESEVMPENLQDKPCSDVFVPMTTEGACALVARDRLRFHPRCGILVKLSNNNKSAERSRPLDDYNNGVVMTHRPLYDNELFEIRIDRLVDKWSGSIEVGVTTHNPATIRFPSTMTNMDCGTIMMSGCKVLINGQGTCVEYGNFNLDELREGDTIGMMRNSAGKLHYFINSIDQGVAADKVDQQVWGVIDLYGMTVKVSIVDACEDLCEMDTNIMNQPSVSNVPNLPSPVPANTSRYRPQIDEDSLLFHSLRDSYVIIINDGKTAHRPNAFEFFNNGIVMTNRTLKTNELFQVRLDLVIPKWAGSIEIGVTQYSSNDIKTPFKMSHAKSGTWVMAGEDIIRNGSVIIPKYIRNLNGLCEGDTVGVMRKDMGILHFFVNGVDQGPAAFNIPGQVFGVIDLYGRVAQATIVDTYSPPTTFSPESPNSFESNTTVYPEMCFHRVHGRNARLSRTRLTASRTAVYSEFNDAVLFSSRPLRECDMFELRIDSMVDCWIGSLEIGVTAIRPDDLDDCVLAGTATDLNYDTYILSGSAMMKDGECVRSGYSLDLDTLTVGSRVGVMWHADRSLHYYLDGMDMGKAWFVPHLNIYAVVDLYGQCTQVTILQNEERTFNYNGCPLADNPFFGLPRLLATPPPPYWSFSEYYGDNVRLTHEYSVAKRLTPDPMGALVFSSDHLAVGEMFEIKITECQDSFAGGFRMGVTDINILNAHVNRSLPPSIIYLPHYTAYVDGRYMKYSKPGTREQDWCTVSPSFEWLRPGDRVGLKKTTDGRVLVYYNCECIDTAFERVPDKVYVVMELYGCVYKIQAIKRDNVVALPQTIPNDSSYIKPTTEVEVDLNMESCTSETEGTLSTVTVMPSERRRRSPLPYTFHYVHGKNIKLCSSDTVAVRTSGYNDAIAIVSQPLRRGHSFRFRIDKVDEEWEGSVAIGAMATLPTDSLPPVATRLDPAAWVLTSDHLYDGTCYLRAPMAIELEDVNEQSVLTLHFRFNSDLVVELDGRVLAVVGSVSRLNGHVYPLVDLYGKVCQVSVLLHPYSITSGTSLDLPIIAENRREESLAELEQELENTSEDRLQRRNRAFSENNLIEDFEMAGPSADVGDASFDDVRVARSKVMHRSLTLTSDRGPGVVQKSRSTHNFGTEEFDGRARADCDTNIRHNDRYPEADVDNLDNEIVDALTLETGNLPDLTEERSSSTDDSARRDDAETFSVENLNYLNRILGLDRESEGSLEAEWEASGEGCEHLHLVLKYWNFLVLPYPELRRAVSWGQVECYCGNCVPDAEPSFAGWVRIERIDGIGAATRGFWHIVRSTLGAAQAVERAVAKRPAEISSTLLTTPSDVWMDEEGKPHHTVLAIEIDIEGNEADKDRLLAFLIYMKPHIVFVDDNPPSLDE
ncbi:neuralized-like protein 4 isoform X2 [Pieris napi]|uniref:neuralized-like protein 4 isoform X2 n=1 Tax=Pieris napi TaxID=78633 RepID=UPI001FB87EF2|nr:neuralized-like protein 4 isoform X2 [Pieris napi]